MNRRVLYIDRTFERTIIEFSLQCGASLTPRRWCLSAWKITIKTKVGEPILSIHYQLQHAVSWSPPLSLSYDPFPSLISNSITASSVKKHYQHHHREYRLRPSLCPCPSSSHFLLNPDTYSFFRVSKKKRCNISPSSAPSSH